MPELSGKYSEGGSPRKRRRSRSSSGSARSRSRERDSSPAADKHRHNGTDERKSKWSDGKEKSRNRFRVGGSREREKLSWADERDRGHYASSRDDYYDKRDDIQRQRQEAFIARYYLTWWWELYKPQRELELMMTLNKTGKLSCLTHVMFFSPRRLQERERIGELGCPEVWGYSPRVRDPE